MHQRAGKLAVILHADIAGSTTLVQQDEHTAHEQIGATFRRFSKTIARYHGRVRELRGDALLAEFERASDAVAAALAFQSEHTQHNTQIEDTIRPAVRVGVAMGEVISADRTVTGAGVVLAQRIEQLAQPGGVCITGAIREALPQRMPFQHQDLGEQSLKGFSSPVHAFVVRLRDDANPPEPSEQPLWRQVALVRGLTAAMLIILVGGIGVLAWYQLWAPGVEPVSLERMSHSLPDRPSIAVLPFDFLGEEPEEDYLADGLTNDLITALSRFSNLFVIASHSSFVYKDKPVKVQDVSQDLGVRYVLEGSIQKSVDEVRINTQLIDALNDRHLWAERYDRQTSDLLAIQDEIVDSVVASLAVQMNAAERERARGKKTDNLQAYDYYLRAADIRFEWDRSTNQRARRLLEKAVELDPHYARAYSALAWTHVNDWRWGWSEDTEASKKLALEAARKATELDPFDAEGYHALGVIHLYNREFDKAIPLYEKAVSLNPNDVRRLVGTAPAWIYVGRAEEAVAQIERAMRLNPHHSDNDLNFLGWAYYAAKDYEKALATLQKIEKSPWRGVLAATYVRLGRMERARSEVETLLEENPEYSVERGKTYPYKTEEQRRHLYDPLAEAGVPDK